MSRLYGPVHRFIGRTASVRGGLLTMLKRAWCSRKIPQEAQGRSSKAETRKCPISTSRASRAGGAGPISTRSMSIRPTGAWTGER